MDEKGIMIPIERIEQAILLIRGQKVMLDADLAVLYEVPTKALNGMNGDSRRILCFDWQKKKRVNWSQIVTGSKG